MSQSKAKPIRPRPVTIDLIFVASVATQSSSQIAENVFRCPHHCASTSAPKTTLPDCQLKPTCPPAMPPLMFPEPISRVPLSSVAPKPKGVVVPPLKSPTNPIFDDAFAQP